MVPNLMMVLCDESDARPVLNMGTLCQEGRADAPRVCLGSKKNNKSARGIRGHLGVRAE